MCEPPTVAALVGICNQRLHDLGEEARRDILWVDEVAWLITTAKDIQQLADDDLTRRRLYHNILTKGG